VATVDQQKVYDQFWNDFGGKIRDGEGIGGFHRESTQRICTTIVSRLPKPASTLLSNFMAQLSAQDPGHYYYPITDYHFTLLDISPVVLDGNFGHLSSEAVSAICTLAKSMSVERPLCLSARGLGVFPTTVFLQLLDIDGRVTELRNMVKRIIADELSITLMPPLVSDIVFANTVRFCQIPSVSVFEFVSAAREVPAFEFAANEFEVVSTDKALSETATIVHKRIRLEDSAATFKQSPELAQHRQRVSMGHQT
jgi:hypothetical protein